MTRLLAMIFLFCTCCGAQAILRGATVAGATVGASGTGGGSGTVIFSEDWESKDGTTWAQYPDAGSTTAGWENHAVTAAVVTTEHHGGTHSVRLDTACGTMCTDLMWYRGGDTPHISEPVYPMPTDYYLSWWVKMGPSFNLGGNWFKLLYIHSNGTFYYDGYDNGSDYYLRVIVDGSVNDPVYPELTDLTLDSAWHHAEAHVTISGGTHYWQMWWDGTYIGQDQGSGGAFEEIGFGLYGNGTPSGYLYMDDLKICTGGRCP